jgi:hypothetical protein
MGAGVEDNVTADLEERGTRKGSVTDERSRSLVDWEVLAHLRKMEYASWGKLSV